MSKTTKDKYYQFMLACYNAKQFDIKKMQLDYKVSTRICTVMRERGLVMRKGNQTIWIGDVPSLNIASIITKECRRQTKLANAQNKIDKTQLAIKPVRKVEYVPSEPLTIKGSKEYPLIDVVISFFAGMIAAGFISLIWK
jgi:hypothetical protein